MVESVFAGRGFDATVLPETGSFVLAVVDGLSVFESFPEFDFIEEDISISPGFSVLFFGKRAGSVFGLVLSGVADFVSPEAAGTPEDAAGLDTFGAEVLVSALTVSEGLVFLIVAEDRSMVVFGDDGVASSFVVVPCIFPDGADAAVALSDPEAGFEEAWSSCAASVLVDFEENEPASGLPGLAATDFAAGTGTEAAFSED